MQIIDAVALEKELKNLIAEIAEIDTAKVTPNANFVEDLGMDSMMALEILASIEKKYKVKIPEDYLGKISTLSHVIEMVKKFLSEKK